MLDTIRGTAIASQEAGQITQSIGATNIPVKTIRKICGDLLGKFKIDLTVPGLLFIDSPGHSSFVTLRKRGGAIADIAILVVDINEGFKEQTDESLNILKEYKTPFIIAATKIDKIKGWYPIKESGFLSSLEKQREDVKNELDNKIYNLVAQLMKRGFEADRFDKIDDFTKKIAIVPVSGKTGEGLPEILLMLAGLAQKFLKDRLKLSKIGKGTVLEVKEVKGLGTVIDVILYDGSIERGDFIIIGGKEPITTKIRSLLKPKELRELRIEREFEKIEKVDAAAGVRISAPDLENVIPGSPIIFVKSPEEVENAKFEVQKEVEEIEFVKQLNGVVIKASTLGGLEALIKLLTEENIPIRKAQVGKVTREDIIEAQTSENEFNKVILVFDLKTPEDVKSLAKDLGVTIFENNVIYRLVEEFKEWGLNKKERKLEEKLLLANRPAELLVLKGAVFRTSNPAIFGVEVLRGYLKTGSLLKRLDGKIIGKIKEMQLEGKTVNSAKKDDRIAISMENVIIGKHINEGDKLFTVLNNDDLIILKEVFDKLSESEKELLNEMV